MCATIVCAIAICVPVKADRSPLPSTSTLSQNTTPPTKIKVNESEVFEDVTANRIQKLKLFLDAGGNPNRFLHAAINAGSIEAVQLMLDRRANPNLLGDEGLTPIMIAAKATYRSGAQMSELLIKKGAKVNARASRGSTPLMFASWGVANHYEDEYVKVVKLLIKNGAKVNVKNQMGDSPLSIAKRGNWNKIVTTLKSAGAKS
jgi:uncharacterized protein